MRVYGVLCSSTLYALVDLIITVVLERIKQSEVVLAGWHAHRHAAGGSGESHCDLFLFVFLAGNLLIRLHLPHDIRLRSTIIFGVVDHITRLRLDWPSLALPPLFLVLNFFKKAENIDRELQLSSVGRDVLVPCIDLHFIFYPRFDPIPVASVLVRWCIHAFQISEDSSLLISQRRLKDGLQAGQDTLTLAPSIGKQRLQSTFFAAIQRGCALENGREVPAHRGAYGVSESHSHLWMLVVHLVAIGLDHLVSDSKYPFHPVLEVFVIDGEELLHQLQEWTNLLCSAFVRSLQNVLGHLFGELLVLIADMGYEFRKFFTFISMFGSI